MPEPFLCRPLDRLDVDQITDCGWQQLFAAQPDARFYHHPDWLLAANDCLLNPPLIVASVSLGGKTVLLLPCQLRARGHRLRTAVHDHLSLGDILIHPDLSAAQARAALQQALDTLGSTAWDWQFGNLPERSALLACLDEHPGWERRAVRRSAWFALHEEMPPASGKLRRNLKRLRSRLQDNGHVQVQWISTSDQLPAALQLLLALEAAGWKGKSGLSDNPATDWATRRSTAITDHPALSRFYHRLLTPHFAGLRPVITLLWLDEQCLAAQFALQSGSCLSLLKIAYSEAHRSFSPGSLLLQDTAAMALERGVSTLSLVTAPAWAERWHPRSEPVWHVTRYANNAGGLALRTLEHLKQTARDRLNPAA